ncbi:hypothetical protein GLP30_09530 [Photobacterium phosphoreum]|uniref:Phage tail protein n=1 Tax=Photobacterium phosphoreum TaxID=659 RepID=A0AAW4ZLV3_PHOPO|nr:putative phage tail assembly chaperone [Photobacterium phosphoreum]MCD9491061.1 hypothetical protein [Photobacterium phosphoreum]MCF2190329.1 hypothetical protein [Photobacterium phosphoreum]MCF2300916.1 hypothetical protein [Photobacterium phosphoreum]
MEQKKIVLAIGGESLSFVPTEVDYNDYMNELMPDNKVAPAHNFVFNTAVEESKPAVREIAATNPSAVVQIAAVLMQEFAPALDIKVKK